MKRLLVLSALFAAIQLPALPAHAETGSDWRIENLMQIRQQIKSATAHFTERRYLQILREPLESSGVLSYVAPDQVQKETLQPKPERLSIDRDTLTIDEGPSGEKRTLSLQEYPEIWAFVESIRATLAGDLPALTRFYSVQFTGNAAAWQMLLLPEQRKMQDLVKWIRIDGSQGSIRSIETEERNGDHSEMTVTQDQP